jgi:glycosyltransferase involved in cell wall biosynthesis
MRIVIPTGIFPPDIGGPASYVPRIAAALAARGHAVEVVTLADAPAAGGEYPFPVRRIPRGMARIPRMIRTIDLIRRLARRADLVYANGLFIEAAFATALAGRPLVMKIAGDWAWEQARNHGAGDPLLEDFQRRRQPLRWEAVKALRSIVTRRAGLVIIPSRYFAGMVSAWRVPEDRLEIIHNALMPLPESPPEKLPAFSGKTLVTAVRLIRLKRIDGMLELVRSRKDLRLVVAGDGPERENLERLARTLGIEDRVTFLGAVSPVRVAGLLKAADAFVLNSVSENFPHSVLEAFAAGAPVVAPATGGIPEAVTNNENGLLFPPDDSEGLKNAVARLFSEPGLRAALVEGGRQTLRRRFQWDALVDRTEAALNRACQRGDRR